METLQIILTVFHLLVSVALMAIVLLQEGRQQGLSGAIAGGAETFFGKNKARTIDAMLKKFTKIVAALFIVTSIVLSLFINNFVSPAPDNSGSMNITPDMFQTEGGMQNIDWGAMGIEVDDEGNPIFPEMEEDVEGADGEGTAEAPVTPAE